MAGKKKLPKDPKTPAIQKKRFARPPSPGTARKSNAVVGGPVYAGSRTGGVLRSQRRRQK